MNGGVVALVPVRGLEGGKTRLAGELPPEARAALTRRMLRGVVRAALASGAVDAVVVVSPDPAALAFAVALGEAVVPLRQDPAAPGLNAAVAAGRDWALARGAAALLVLFGDLPLLAAADVRHLLAAEAPLVLAPDRHGTGTNALLLRLDTDPAAARFAFRFGAGSYARHAVEGTRLSLVTATSIAPGTAFDLDTPDDVRALLASSGREEGGTDDALAVLGVPLAPFGNEPAPESERP